MHKISGNLSKDRVKWAPLSKANRSAKYEKSLEPVELFSQMCRVVLLNGSVFFSPQTLMIESMIELQKPLQSILSAKVWRSIENFHLLPS